MELQKVLEWNNSLINTRAWCTCCVCISCSTIMTEALCCLWQLILLSMCGQTLISFFEYPLWGAQIYLRLPDGLKHILQIVWVYIYIYITRKHCLWIRMLLCGHWYMHKRQEFWKGGYVTNIYCHRLQKACRQKAVLFAAQREMV